VRRDLPNERRALLGDIARLAESPAAVMPGYSPAAIAIRLRDIAGKLELGRNPRMQMMLAAAVALLGVEQYDGAQTQPRGRDRPPLDPEAIARLSQL
jgi:hypothetical protein